ncbi:ubiquitin-like-specific protease ESD4 [Cimex lectularius]|uniref:Ubiquitin-like protease family profile domain-containing protein n=1 Tax=Cimex lectularius TaxID=79782 RepID=A0A8I6S6P2_CIMLE|nr:ubiquitin-like-specific protease ESD4 [Cimex lectularius]
MMSKILNTIWSYFPWTRNHTSHNSVKRSREVFGDDEELLPVPVKRQRLTRNPQVLSDFNKQPSGFQKIEVIDLTKQQSNNLRKRNLGLSNEIVLDEIIIKDDDDDEIVKERKPKFFSTKYENVLKENILSVQNKSSCADILSPSKFKNKHKAPRHIRSPTKIRNRFCLLSNSSTEIVDPIASQNTFRRVPIGLRPSKMSDASSTSQNSINMNSRRSYMHFTNGKRIQDFTRDDYSRLLGTFISANSKIKTKDKTTTEIIDLDDVSDSETEKNKQVEETIIINDDDDSNTDKLKLISTPKVSRVNSFSQKIEKHNEATNKMLELTAKVSASKEKFEFMRNQYTELCYKHQLLRFKSVQDALNERIKDYLKITETVLDTEGIEALPELTPKMQQRIDEAFRPQPENQVMVSKFNYNVTRRDLNCLTRLNWLNDEVINFYMELIIDRGKLKPNYPPVHTFSTFFFPRLKQSGYTGVRRWTRKVDVFQKDMILVPIHLHVHWCMACIHLKKKTISFYDSMGSTDPGVLSLLRDYIQSEHQDKKNAPFDTSDWTLTSVTNIPQQKNGSDCGVFACTFAEFLARDATFIFSQKDMPYFRRKMAYEILEGSLLT